MTDGSRKATIAAVSTVGAAAALLSFRHQAAIAAAHGETALSACVVPVLTDGALLAGTIALLDAARKGSRTRWARCTVGAGIAISLLLNVVHGLAWGWLGVVVAGWPPLALVLCVETLAAMLRGGTPVPLPRGKGTPADEATQVRKPAPQPVPKPKPVPEEPLPLAATTAPPGVPVPASDTAPTRVPRAPELEHIIFPDEVPEVQVHSNGHSADVSRVLQAYPGSIPTVVQVRATLSCGQARAQKALEEVRALISA